MHSAISITEQNDTNKVQKTNAQTTTECQVKKIIKNNKKKTAIIRMASEEQQ